MTRTRATITGLALTGLIAAAPAAPGTAPHTTLRIELSDTGATLFLDDGELGSLRRETARSVLVGANGRELASFESRTRPLTPDHAYPREVSTSGRLTATGEGFRAVHTLLAPPSPLWIEGLGLEVDDDEPGLNREEHERLRAWLSDQGLPADTSRFQRLHADDAGRELHVWYEISGRRKDGRFETTGDARVLAQIDSGYRSEGGALKIHHARPGENGRFFYHRRSLELADRLIGPGGRELVSHQCGCYGYGIASDFMTLGDSLYHVVADWLDDRVAAEFFLGLGTSPDFPWLSFEGRRRARDLARRVASYDLTDAHGALFARVRLRLADDPAWPDLGDTTYEVDLVDASGTATPLARLDRTPTTMRIQLSGDPTRWEEGLARLDRLLAAMPTQVERGDGIRDSHLGQFERWIDLVRLLREPSPERLADAVSDVDALTAAGKVEALLGLDPARFAAAAGTRPPAPIGFTANAPVLAQPSRGTSPE